MFMGVSRHVENGGLAGREKTFFAMSQPPIFLHDDPHHNMQPTPKSFLRLPLPKERNGHKRAQRTQRLNHEIRERGWEHPQITQITRTERSNGHERTQRTQRHDSNRRWNRFPSPPWVREKKRPPSSPPSPGFGATSRPSSPGPSGLPPGETVSAFVAGSCRCFRHPRCHQRGHGQWLSAVRNLRPSA
jgi:hypothetical protein